MTDNILPDGSSLCGPRVINGEKVCVNCKHCTVILWGNHYICDVAELREPRNYVTGELRNTLHKHCSDVRSEHGICGPSGRLYEPSLYIKFYNAVTNFINLLFRRGRL